MVNCILIGVAAAFAAGAEPVAPPAQADSAHQKEIESWRQQRVERLRGPTGWLSLVGLDWLREGRNTLGSAPDNSIVLAKWPSHLGTIVLSKGKVTIALDRQADATIDGAKKTEATLVDDSQENKTIVTSGTLSFYLLQRGHRFALRVRDTEAPTRLNFAGLDYFDIDPSWRIEAKWEAYQPPRVVEEPNVLGDVDKVVVPGAAVFERGGKTYRVEPVIEVPGDINLFLVFADRTSGKETYGASRFVYTEPPKDGKVIIDFNKAYNPPCAFTPYSTCPLPVQQNRLDMRVTAGEKKYRAAVD